jgi:hypothetical protein
MIPISAKEIKEFWHGFCQRRKIDSAVRDAGDKRIEEDPEYWADHTMADLLEELSRPSGS